MRRAGIRQRYKLPVIFLTAHADRSHSERAKVTGPFAYLVKPLASAALQSAIEVAIYRHRMERNLEEQEAWLRTTLASVADGTVVTGPDGSIRSLNRAAEQITGWTNEEAKGLPYAKVFPLMAPCGSAGEQALEPVEPVEMALLRDVPVAFNGRWRLLDRSGRELVVEGSASPVRDAHVVYGAVLTFGTSPHDAGGSSRLMQAQRMDTAARLAASVSEEYSAWWPSSARRRSTCRTSWVNSHPAGVPLKKSTRPLPPPRRSHGAWPPSEAGRRPRWTLSPSTACCGACRS